MRTIAFVGPSGTGKSYRAMLVARKYGADAIIDDGLLISHNKVLAGISAKRESTKIASVKRALFTTQSHANQVIKAIKDNNILCVMVLGTSDGMVERIASVLQLPPIERIIYINEIATEDEMNTAKQMRLEQGKHVIPVPTFEIKKDFSGYFLHPLRIFQKNMNKYDEPQLMDKSIVRPTFSYLGDYHISDYVVEQIAAYEARRVQGVHKVNSVNVRNGVHGVHLDMVVELMYGYNLIYTSRCIQYEVCKGIENHTSINARRVHIYIKSLIVNK